MKKKPEGPSSARETTARATSRGVRAARFTLAANEAWEKAKRQLERDLASDFASAAASTSPYEEMLKHADPLRALKEATAVQDQIRRALEYEQTISAALNPERAFRELVGKSGAELTSAAAGARVESTMRQAYIDAILGGAPFNATAVAGSGVVPLDEWFRPEPAWESVQKERAELRTKIHSLISARDSARRDAKAVKEELDRYLKREESLKRIEHVLRRVRQDAWGAIEGDESFQGLFLNGEERKTVVVSIDIRRSTELMLKARSAKQFAAFLTALCSSFISIVTEHFGVYDKFTGDGILAFFPEFFSGDDAALWALRAAEKCHLAFEEIYRAHRGSFLAILTETGLGIGMDYGSAQIVGLADGLTVVGPPVVYACRMGSAPAGKTFCNQGVFEILQERHKGQARFRELVHKTKEGPLVAYETALVSLEKDPSPPKWFLERAGSEPAKPSDPSVKKEGK